LNPGYAGISTPVLRNPRLFHQNTMLSNPTYYATPQPAAALSTSRLYTPYNSPYTSHSQSRYSVQATASSYPQSHSYYHVSPGPPIYSPMPFSSYVPITYAPTNSSNGLALILIATLILVALDLMIVRPLKRHN
jgi:hypothetical protein